MNRKRPYNHILKNLFHEQATEIIPLLLPEYQVKQVLDLEMPTLKSTEIAGPPSELAKGFAGLALPEAQVLNVYQTEWIEHSGNFERVYRAKSAEFDKPVYLVIEVQTDREDPQLPRRLLCTFARADSYADQDVVQEDDTDEDEQEDDTDENEHEEEDVENEHKGTIVQTLAYPAVLCPFPQAVPAPIRDMLQGQLMNSFNFEVLGLWEKDAREMLNMHVTAIYYLLPVMKNADAPLLGLAIAELAQRFQDDEMELGRHLTGLSLMLQQSEMMSQEEKLAAQEYLEPFMHLIKNDPYEELG